jgi:Spy/CpxP family protein refolding chaperone
MKKLNFIIVLIVLLLSINATAQNQGRLPVLRERVTNVKFNEISRRMNLYKTEAEQLRPVFIQYEKEKATLLTGRQNINSEIRNSVLTEQEVEEFYLKRLELTKKMADLREKYYHEFRKVLTPKQIVQFHRIETELNRRILQNLNQRFNEQSAE